MTAPTTAPATARRAPAPRAALARPRAEAPPAAVVALTPDGRALLERRLQHVLDVSLPRLRPLLARRDRDERDVAEFERLSAEAERLDRVLGVAITLQPADSVTVRWGSRVLIEMPDGERAWIRPVHPVEAFLDDERVSVTSPVSRAVLDACAGEVVTVHGPQGDWECRVVEIRSHQEGPVGAG
ncbi:MAG: GreA/GreB family elongation factor [Actinomycetales bacterium]|nr:GreA/GreB family elongation factor [Actinomycetales bacterium]